MFSFYRIAEQKIQEAIKKGDFDNIPGKGKPLHLDDDIRVPEDLRLVYKILKNASCLPPELQVKKEIIALEELLTDLPDGKEKYRAMKRLNFLVTKLNMMRKVPINLEENQRYYPKLVEKLEK